MRLLGAHRFCYESSEMIEGTKPYRGRGGVAKISETPTTNVETPRHEPDAPDAVNLPGNEARAVDRRTWFRSLVPALGSGLVEILRASNNLERDLADLKKSAPDSEK